MDDAELVHRYLELRRCERAGGEPYLCLLDPHDIRRIVDLWDAALLRFIRRRYDCGSDETEDLFRRWSEEAADGFMVGHPWFNDDGEVRLPADISDMFDKWAAELGLTPR